MTGKFALGVKRGRETSRRRNRTTERLLPVILTSRV